MLNMEVESPLIENRVEASDSKVMSIRQQLIKEDNRRVILFSIK